MTDNTMIPTKEKFAELAKAILDGASAARHDDRFAIPYRPKMNKITGGMVASIFLQQVEHYWVINGSKPFYKFAATCSHELYKEGDSWQEELDLGRSEFEAARSKVATKIKRKVSKKEARSYKDDNGRLQKPNHLILYWTDSNMMTWYEFNTDLMNAYTLIQHHGFSEEDVLTYLDHMYGVIDFEAFLGIESPEPVSPSEQPEAALSGNVENKQSLIPETPIDSELESKDSNIALRGDKSIFNQNSEGVIQTANGKINPDPNTSRKGNLNQSKDVFNDMKMFARTYTTPRSMAVKSDPPKMPSPQKEIRETTPLRSNTGGLSSSEAISQKPKPQESQESQEEKADKPRKKRKTSPNGRIEYKEWLIAVLDLFNLANAFTGMNYKDPTISVYTTTAKNMRLMANDFNERNPDKPLINATVVREFYDWMRKKGWKDIGQKALIDRFPEYLALMADNPSHLPYRITELNKWITSEEKRTKKPVDDSERVKLQELLDIEIITHYYQLVDQIPQAERERIERGLADGSIYNPFN